MVFVFAFYVSFSTNSWGFTFIFFRIKKLKLCRGFSVVALGNVFRGWGTVKVVGWECFLGLVAEC